MATLILIRHAKAETARPGQTDVSRELTPRGMTDAAAACEVLASLTIGSPVTVLVSTATRTQQTYDIVGTSLPVHQRINERRLYDAAVSTVIDLAVEAGGETVIVIGHNPTLRDVASHLSDVDVDSFPTSAIAVLNGDWNAISSGTWLLESLVVPRGD